MLVAEILAPPPVLAIVIVVVAWQSTTTFAEASKWAVLAIVFTSLIPTLIILGGVRRGQLTDHHIGRREQRPIPLFLGVVSVLTGLVILAAGRAPHDVVTLVASMMAGLATATAVSLFWKVSLHTAVSAGALTALAFLFGLSLLLLLPLVVLIGWARVKLGAHTWPQVIVGSVLGAAVVGTVFAFLH